MPASTVPLGLPYPIGSDPVADGDNAIRGLAESVDDLFVGADYAVTLNGVTDSGEGCMTFKRGRMATLRVACTFTAIVSQGAPFLGLSGPVWPPSKFRGLVWNYTGSTWTPISIDPTTGYVVPDVNIPLATQLYGTLTYPL